MNRELQDALAAERPAYPELVRGLTKKEYREIIIENGVGFCRPYTRWWRDFLPNTAVQIDTDIIMVLNGPDRIGFHLYGCNVVVEREIRFIYLRRDKDGKVWVEVCLR